MHSTFGLSHSTTTSRSSPEFSIGTSCFRDAFHLFDDIFKNPVKDEITLNETGNPTN